MTDTVQITIDRADWERIGGDLDELVRLRVRAAEHEHELVAQGGRDADRLEAAEHEARDAMAFRERVRALTGEWEGAADDDNTPL